MAYNPENLSPIGGVSSLGASVYSYSVQEDETINDILDALSVLSIALSHPIGYFDDAYGTIKRGDILLLVDGRIAAVLPKLSTLVCTGSGTYSDSTPYCRFNVNSGIIFEEMTGSYSEVNQSLSGKVYYYDGSSAITYTVTDTAPPFQDGANFTIINNGTNTVTVSGEDSTATFNGALSYVIQPGTTVEFLYADSNTWVTTSAQSIRGSTVDSAKYQSINTFSSGANSIDETYLGSYNRMTVTAALTFNIKDTSTTWQEGDVLDFWGVSETGGPFVVTFQGATSAADFNENGNIGSADFVASQSTTILIRLIYVGSNTWDVWELYI